MPAKVSNSAGSVRKKCGVKERLEEVGMTPESKKGYAAFLEKRGLSDRKWRGAKFSKKFKGDE